MLAPDRLKKVVEEYTALLAQGNARALSDEERQRLELMRDLILEAGVALDAEGNSRNQRAPRTKVALEVSFQSAKDAARSLSRDIGTGGISLQTDQTLPNGSSVQMQIAIPGWASPMKVEGEVVWARDGAMGVAFRGLTPAQQEDLKKLVSEAPSFLDRMRSSLGTRGNQPLVSVKVTAAEERPAEAPPPTPAPTRAAGVLVRLTDRALAASIADMLSLNGIIAAEKLPEHVTPKAIVADPPRASEAVNELPGLPVVFVNVSGPDALIGRLSRLPYVHFVPRPATSEALLQAVRKALQPRTAKSQQDKTSS